MTSKKKFSIPSIDDIETAESKPTQIKSLFRTHQQSVFSGAPNAPQNKPPSLKNDSQQRSDVAMVTKPSNQPEQQPSVPSTEKYQKMTAAAVVDNQEVKIVPVTSSTNPGSGSPQKKGKTNSIIVNSRQRGNPILKFIRNVPWEFGEIIPDYQLAQTSCALFLSLRYHHLNPDYIHVRLKQLGQNYALRVILVQVDVKDPYHSLKELARVCILADCTLILAWSAEEAGRYLETYKAFENKPADLIKEQTDNNFLSKMTDTLTSVKSVNRTDVITLLNAFGSFSSIVEASSEDLSLCPGFGPQKAQRLHDIFHEPFLKQKKNVPEKN